MRNSFLKKITEFAASDRDVMLITGDLGYSVFESFAERFPDQFLNTGICEQTMAGIAAGMALCGKKVFVYSIGNFPTLRCLEQIRNDICYHRLPVTIVTNGAGMAYGSLGMSHHATEDLSILRALPEMTVTSPADPVEVELLMEYFLRTGKPGFMRMNRGGEKKIHSETNFDITVLNPVIPSPDCSVAIISAGEITSSVFQIADILKSRGISVSAWSCPFIKPLPCLTPVYGPGVKLLVSLEENNVCGGLGGAIAEAVSLQNSRIPLLRIGMPDQYCSLVGKQIYLRQQYDLGPEQVADRIARRLMEL